MWVDILDIPLTWRARFLDITSTSVILSRFRCTLTLKVKPWTHQYVNHQPDYLLARVTRQVSMASRVGVNSRPEKRLGWDKLTWIAPLCRNLHTSTVTDRRKFNNPATKQSSILWQIKQTWSAFENMRKSVKSSIFKEFYALLFNDSESNETRKNQFSAVASVFEMTGNFRSPEPPAKLWSRRSSLSPSTSHNFGLGSPSSTAYLHNAGVPMRGHLDHQFNYWIHARKEWYMRVCRLRRNCKKHDRYRVRNAQRSAPRHRRKTDRVMARDCAGGRLATLSKRVFAWIDTFLMRFFVFS